MIHFDPNLPAALAAVPSGGTAVVDCGNDSAGAVLALAAAAGMTVSDADLHGSTITLTLSRA